MTDVVNDLVSYLSTPFVYLPGFVSLEHLQPHDFPFQDTIRSILVPPHSAIQFMAHFFRFSFLIILRASTALPCFPLQSGPKFL